MINYITLAVALLLSAVAAYYSIIGLTAIFATAFIPIVVMGCTLELSKIVATSWLYRNWKIASLAVKYYLTVAIIILMLITSMGTFGYLSKAHIDQGVPVSDVASKLELVNEKISISKANIEISRKSLKQLDDTVDQIMARSESEKSVDKARYVRRSQQAERQRIMADIEAEQKRVSVLNEERAPLAAQVKKVEAEVGPIKYISALFTDDDSQQSLEKSVRWVIILIVIVFDPLAIALLIAANQGLLKREDNPLVEEQSWTEKAAQLIKKKKKSILEIDKNSVLEIK